MDKQRNLPKLMKRSKLIVPLFETNQTIIDLNDITFNYLSNITK
jgi:hypothetical protein